MRVLFDHGRPRGVCSALMDHIVEERQLRADADTVGRSMHALFIAMPGPDGRYGFL
jgi:hypothetical protein